MAADSADNEKVSPPPQPSPKGEGDQDGAGEGPHPSAARIVDLYERRAADWDVGRRTSAFFEKPVLDRLISRLPEGASVLDIGCGAGWPFAAHVLEGGMRVTGVDSAPSLIALCAERYPGGEWIAADMRSLDLGRRFDALIAWHSLFHLSVEDQRAMFDVFARHAAPGALLMFTSGDRRGEALGEMGGETLYHASLSLDEYRALLAEHGFEVIELTARDPECGEATWWLARRDG